VTIKVFVSHASEDKERFVLDFAKRLRKKGIDAWIDKWEMLPGDSLVDKIFEEGIKEASALIVVLSQNSVKKPWVREELNAGMVKRIEKGCKLIPVVIDECEVPECLKSTLWEPIKNVNDYDNEFNRIVLSILGQTDKPPLGDLPDYSRADIKLFPSLSRIDSLVFSEACKLALEQDTFIMTQPLINIMEAMEVNADTVLESLEILDEQGYVQNQRVLGGRVPYFSITTFGFENYLRHNDSKYEEKLEKVVFSILNGKQGRASEIAEQTNINPTIVYHILDFLTSKGLLKTVKVLGGDIIISATSPQLKRLF